MKSVLRNFSQIIFYFLLSANTLVLIGCGASGSKYDASEYSLSAEMSLVKDLTSEERAIATRICYAYQSKSSSFRGKNYNVGTFTYNIASKSCTEERTDYAVKSFLKATSSAMNLETDSKNIFVSAIQTEESGYLAQLCEKIQNNRPISNTVTEGGTKVQISFFRDTHDSYALRYFTTDEDSKVVRIDSMEILKVITRPVPGSDQIQGMDESYSLFKTCKESGKYSEFIQSFSSFTK